MSGSRSSPGLAGVGIGWRPELALPIDRWSLAPEAGARSRATRPGFVEVIAEGLLDPTSVLPPELELLRERGLAVVPHGVSLSLGGAEPVDVERARALGRLARRLGAPLVSEHVAFVRAGGHESGHLLPVPRTREALEVTVENVRRAQEALDGVPLALENIAALFAWPTDELSEAEFLSELVERTGARLLLDLANLHASATNLGWDPVEVLDALPLDRVAYVHVAGGVRRHGRWHDTHAHPLPLVVVELVRELCARRAAPGVLLERDDRFPPPAELRAELDALRAACAAGVPV